MIKWKKMMTEINEPTHFFKLLILKSIYTLFFVIVNLFLLLWVLWNVKGASSAKEWWAVNRSTKAAKSKRKHTDNGENLYWYSISFGFVVSAQDHFLSKNGVGVCT